MLFISIKSCTNIFLWEKWFFYGFTQRTICRTFSFIFLRLYAIVHSPFQFFSLLGEGVRLKLRHGQLWNVESASGTGLEPIAVCEEEGGKEGGKRVKEVLLPEKKEWEVLGGLKLRRYVCVVYGKTRNSH